MGTLGRIRYIWGPFYMRLIFTGTLHCWFFKNHGVGRRGRQGLVQAELQLNSFENWTFWYKNHYISENFIEPYGQATGGGRQGGLPLWLNEIVIKKKTFFFFTMLNFEKISKKFANWKSDQIGKKNSALANFASPPSPLLKLVAAPCCPPPGPGCPFFLATGLL
jgi:hypothetical protein